MKSRLYGEKLQVLDTQYTEVRMPEAQNTKSKKNLIDGYHKKIKEMQERLKTETNPITINTINGIIADCEENIVSARRAIKSFEFHDNKIKSDIERMRRNAELLKHTGKQSR